jgi:hypothetical protein
LALSFAALELGVRVYQPDVQIMSFSNLIYDRIALLRSGYPAQYDAELGWIPKPEYSGIANVWGTQVTIDQDGIRSNGQRVAHGVDLSEGAIARSGALSEANRGLALPQESYGPAAILALGDSFVFGDQVSDADSWPAQLETKLGRRVINAGVFGYGIDQSVLRAYRLLDLVDVETVVLGLIADDIHRTELSIRLGAAKPYFDLLDGALVRRNDPVPQLGASQTVMIGRTRRVLGYSALVDLVVRRLGLEEWWYAGHLRTIEVHNDGVAVSCRLAGQLRQDLEARGIRLVVLAQYPSWEITDPEAPRNRRALEMMRQLLACLHEHGHEVIDLQPLLQILWDDDPKLFRSLYSDHMTAAGNEFVASILSARL